jgi:hypothetical protein
MDWDSLPDLLARTEAELRAERGGVYSREQVADDLGITSATYRAWLRGQEVRDEHVPKIIVWSGADPSDVWTLVLRQRGSIGPEDRVTLEVSTGVYRTLLAGAAA